MYWPKVEPDVNDEGFFKPGQGDVCAWIIVAMSSNSPVVIIFFMVFMMLCCYSYRYDTILLFRDCYLTLFKKYCCPGADNGKMDEDRGGVRTIVFSLFKQKAAEETLCCPFGGSNWIRTNDPLLVRQML